MLKEMLQRLEEIREEVLERLDTAVDREDGPGLPLGVGLLPFPPN